jgi:hypothetical protein
MDHGINGHVDADALAHALTHTVGPGAPLVLVHGPAALQLAQTLAYAWTDERDVVVLDPPDGVWTADGVRERLQPAVNYTPHRAHAVVVAAAGTLAGLHDRVLKLLEEPPSAAWFLLALEGDGDLDALPPALRGRAGLTLTAPAAAAEVRVAAYVAADVPVAVATRAVEVCHGDLHLERTAVHTADPQATLDAVTVALTRPASGPLPAVRAKAAIAALDAVAAAAPALAATRPAGIRRLLLLQLRVWEARAAAALRNPAVDVAVVLPRVCALLRSCETARVQLTRNVAPDVVLTRAFVALDA